MEFSVAEAFDSGVYNDFDITLHRVSLFASANAAITVPHPAIDCALPGIGRWLAV